MLIGVVSRSEPSAFGAWDDEMSSKRDALTQEQLIIENASTPSSTRRARPASNFAAFTRKVPTDTIDSDRRQGSETPDFHAEASPSAALMFSSSPTASRRPSVRWRTRDARERPVLALTKRLVRTIRDCAATAPKKVKTVGVAGTPTTEVGAMNHDESPKVSKKIEKAQCQSSIAKCESSERIDDQGVRASIGGTSVTQSTASSSGLTHSCAAEIVSPGSLDLEARHEFHPVRRFLTEPSEIIHNGCDNSDYDLVIHVGMVVQHYEVLMALGTGTFGQVVKARDVRSGEIVALKVVKSHPSFSRQARVEVDMLRKLDGGDDRRSGIIQLYDDFVFKGHVCIIGELLDINLYELLQANKYKGLSLNVVRLMAQQILRVLTYLGDAGLIHCDLKPENILLVPNQHPVIRVIDFGCAAEENNVVFTYIQSRYYRAPEVICGGSYDRKIDIWSLGCIVAELFLGLPLFPGVNDYHQMARINEMVGLPSAYLMTAGTESKRYFVFDSLSGGPGGFRLRTEEEFCDVTGEDKTQWKKYFNYDTLPELIDHYPVKEDNGVNIAQTYAERQMFTDFLFGLLNPDPEQRWSAEEASGHPFVRPDVRFGGRGAYHSLVLQQRSRVGGTAVGQHPVAQGAAFPHPHGGGPMGPSPPMHNAAYSHQHYPQHAAYGAYQTPYAGHQHQQPPSGYGMPASNTSYYGGMQQYPHQQHQHHQHQQWPQGVAPNHAYGGAPGGYQGQFYGAYGC